MSISSYLRKFKGNSFFLPAHNRGQSLPKELIKILHHDPGKWDLPELPAFGGPLMKGGIVSNSQDLSALSFNADSCWYGVNGATGLIQSAILSIAKPGEGLLVPRNVHKSAINACILGDINPFIYDLPISNETGHFIPPDKNWLSNILKKAALEENKISGILIVNPTYQGFNSDIIKLVDIVHQYNLPVIVDEAHGTYFAANLDQLPSSALDSEADIVVNSLHKSATGLGQTAVLWHKGSRVNPCIISKSIELLQTSSPSSLLLASCESTLLEIKSSKWKSNLKKKLDKAKGIYNKLLELNIPVCKTQDPLKIVLHTAKSGINGIEFDEFLISKGIFAELPEPSSLTFCLGFSKNNQFVSSLRKNWHEFLPKQKNNCFKYDHQLPDFPLISKGISCRDANNSEFKFKRIEDCQGETSKDFICPYPPGIPLLIPGESISNEHIQWLIRQKKYWPKDIPDELRVVT